MPRSRALSFGLQLLPFNLLQAIPQTREDLLKTAT